MIRGRQVVKRIILTCVYCKKLKSRAYQNPPAEDIPSFRLEDEFAFTDVVDFAGPLFIKVSKYQTSPMMKACIALYTCASSRAVHLELVTNLTALSPLDAFGAL